MAWQGLYILWLVLGHTDYYVTEVYVLRDAIEGIGGYLFPLAMTVTSFPLGRRLLKSKQWRLLHLSGIYFLWAYAFSVYWWAIFYYSNPVPLDYIFYWAGFAAWVLRAAAWTKKRGKAAGQLTPKPIAKVAGALMICGGLVAASIGSVWQATAEAYLYGYAITEIPELYLPYWPFDQSCRSPLSCWECCRLLLPASTWQVRKNSRTHDSCTVEAWAECAGAVYRWQTRTLDNPIRDLRAQYSRPLKSYSRRRWI